MVTFQNFTDHMPAEVLEATLHRTKTQLQKSQFHSIDVLFFSPIFEEQLAFQFIRIAKLSSEFFC